MHLKMFSTKCWPFCSGLNVLKHWGLNKMALTLQMTLLNTFFFIQKCLWIPSLHGWNGLEVNTGSVNGLVPCRAKPLLELTLTNLWCYKTFLGHYELNASGKYGARMKNNIIGNDFRTNCFKSMRGQIAYIMQKDYHSNHKGINVSYIFI